MEVSTWKNSLRIADLSHNLFQNGDYSLSPKDNSTVLCAHIVITPSSSIKTFEGRVVATCIFPYGFSLMLRYLYIHWLYQFYLFFIPLEMFLTYLEMLYTDLFSMFHINLQLIKHLFLIPNLYFGKSRKRKIVYDNIIVVLTQKAMKIFKDVSISCVI